MELEKFFGSLLASDGVVKDLAHLGLEALKEETQVRLLLPHCHGPI